MRDTFRTVGRREILIAAILAAMLGCKKPPQPQAVPTTGWRTVGTWSGHGSLQTVSFDSTSGALRVRWRTRGKTDGPAGTFLLTAHSAISGRPLQVAVDHRGPGEGTAYVDQDPHDFYMEVDSSNLDWSFTLEEAVSGTLEKTSSAGHP
jgi:hypothetical protein